MLLLSVSVGLPAVKVPTKMPPAVPPGDVLSAIVELTMCITPSVWKIAPPCQPVEVLPLIVLLMIVHIAQRAQAAAHIVQLCCR